MFSFKQWFILITEGANENLALNILQNDQNALNQLIALSFEPKYLPALAFFYLSAKKNLNNLQQYFNKLRELVNKKKINYQPQGSKGVKLNGQLISKWLIFTEFIDGLANLEPKKVVNDIKPIGREDLHQQEDTNRIINNDKVIVYKSYTPQACVKYGQGHSFCVSQPGNTMWQSYRDTQASTFYFVFDKTKGGSDPLRTVVVDVTQNGISLTDANNRTGTIAEYGIDAKAYLNYLKSLGVPTEIFKNIPKSPEEKDEHEQLGKPNEDLNWFRSLSHDYKSKYIGRGHKLTNEQFNFLWENTANDLLNQYVNIGQKLNDYQMDKVFTSNSLKKSYLRQRLIADEHTKDLSRKEFDQLSLEQQSTIPDKAMIFAATDGNKDMVELLMSKVTHFDEAMRIAALNGHKDIVELLMSKVIHFKDVMIAAASGGHKDIVELLMSKATHFNDAMRVAASGGHKDIVELLMSKATDFNKAMAHAAGSGHKDIVELMIIKGARNFNTAMEHASMSGYKDIVELMISKGANNFDDAMNYAASSGHKDIIELLISKGATDFNQAMVHAASSGHKDIVELMISKGARNFDAVMEHAAYGGHKDIVELMISKGAKSFNKSMSLAAQYGRKNIVELLMNKATEFDNAMYLASSRGHKDIVELLKNAMQNKTTN